MADETNPSNPTPKKNPQSQKRSTLMTVIVLIVLLGFFWLRRDGSDSTDMSGATTEQPVAQQLPAEQESDVYNDEGSAQTDEAGAEGSDAEGAMTTGTENADDESSAGAV